MATSTVRFAIIVALVVGGVVVIGKAFPSSGRAALPTSSPTGPVGPTPSNSKPPKPPVTADLQGAKLAVYNGTSVSGLASDAAHRLVAKFGAVIPDDAAHIADAPAPVSTTTLYYRTDQGKADAQELIDKFFTPLKVDAKLARLQSGSNVKKDVLVAVFLGSDYATATQQ